MSKFFKSCDARITAKLNLQKLKAVLLSQLNLPLDIIPDDLVAILYFWKSQMGSNATVNILLEVLEFLCGSDVVGKYLFFYWSCNNSERSYRNSNPCNENSNPFTDEVSPPMDWYCNPWYGNLNPILSNFSLALY